MSISERDLKRMKEGDRLNAGRGLFAVCRGPQTVDWRFRKRVKGQTNATTLTIGHYPDMSIDAAIEKAREFRVLAAQGIHPREWQEGEIKKQQAAQRKSQQAATTLREVWNSYERRTALRDRPNSEVTVYDRRVTLNKIFGDWMDRPVADISAQMLEDRFYDYSSQHGSASAARKSFRYLNPILKYAVSNLELLPKNPLDANKDLIKTAEKQNLDRLTIRETVKLLEIISHLHDQNHRNYYSQKIDVTKLTEDRLMSLDAVCLMLLTGIRKNELLRLKISNVYLEKKDYINQDAEGPYFWIVTSKQRQPFGVPITPPMSSILRRRIASSKERESIYVFPSPRPNGADRPISNERGAYPLLKKLMGDLRESGNNRISANVMRTTFASTALECGLSIEQINLITGHVGSIAELHKVATAAYVKAKAESHRKMFELINAKMLDDEIH